MRRMLTHFADRLRARLEQKAHRTDQVEPAPAFAKGDIAECRVAVVWKDLVEQRQLNSGPILYDRHIVREVAELKTSEGRVVMLHFKPWPGVGFDATHFRKVAPRPDELRPATGALLDMGGRPTDV
ncbi:MAG: hypothetical protein WA908_01655 [Pontixanthobacter sp.]